MTLTFPADRNDVTINYSLTDHSLLAINLRSTEDGLVMDVVRPTTVKIKQTSSLIVSCYSFHPLSYLLSESGYIGNIFGPLVLIRLNFKAGIM